MGATPPFSDTLYYVSDYDAIRHLQDTLAFKFCEDIEPIPGAGGGAISFAGFGGGECVCPAGPPGLEGPQGPAGPPGKLPSDYVTKSKAVSIARTVAKTISKRMIDEYLTSLKSKSRSRSRN